MIPNSTRAKSGNLIVPVFSLFALLYFYYFVDPRLIYQQQQPAFFTGFRFLKGFMGYPGGLADYASAFLMQFFVNRIAGAIVLTYLTAMVVAICKPLFAVLTRPNRLPFIELAPGLFLLIFHSNYWYSPAVSVAFCVSLLASYLFLIENKISVLPRMALFFILASATYWLAGGQLYLFALLCVEFEIFTLRKYLSAAIFIAFAALLPFCTCGFLILALNYPAYFHQLPFYYDFKPRVSPFLLYAFLVFAAPISSLVLKRFSLRDTDESVPRFRQKFFRWVFQVSVIACATVAAMAISHDGLKKNSLTMDFYNRQEQWAELTKTMHSIMSQKNILKVFPLYPNRQVLPFYTNRALYHRGVLLDSMFAFWQLGPGAGMLVPNDLGERVPLLCSEIYDDLCFPNAAVRWAFEAYAASKAPSVLKQLALSCAAAGQKQDALHCCAMLDNTLFDRSWAGQCAAACNGDSSNPVAARLIRIRASMPASDFIMHGFGGGPDLDLAELLRQSPKNKMALEYLLASFLLHYQPESIAPYIPYFKTLEYRQLPRHIQEALIFQSLALKKRIDLRGFRISDRIEKQFLDFNRILISHNGDMAGASSELFASFGDTYWFYLYSAKPK